MNPFQSFSITRQLKKLMPMTLYKQCKRSRWKHMLLHQGLINPQGKTDSSAVRELVVQDCFRSLLNCDTDNCDSWKIIIIFVLLLVLLQFANNTELTKFTTEASSCWVSLQVKSNVGMNILET